MSSSAESATGADLMGEVIGAYRVVARLGAGGMGSVWLAEHTSLGRRVAIKVLLPHVSRDEALVERFFVEARAATRVDHPGIVAVHDFDWHSDGSAYIVMEHIAGESLSARLRKDGRLTPDVALRLAHQMALAMAAAHAAGIVHRDLKPDNLFIVPDPAVTGGERVKILDFGIAKLLGDGTADHRRTQTGVIMGTPIYMSPEQCRNAGGVDHRTDIYSLGCVLFEMLTGRPPFDAPTTADVIASHLTDEPRPPSEYAPEISARLDALVLRCLAKDAAQRPASMSELAAELGRGSVTLTKAGPSHSTTERDVGLLATLAPGELSLVPSASPGVRAARVLAAVVVIAAVVVVIALGWRGRRGNDAVPTLAPVLIDASAPLPPPTGIDQAPLVTPTTDAGVDAPRRRAPRGSASEPYDPYEER